MWTGVQVQDTISSEISTPLHEALVSHVIPQLIDTAVRVYTKKTMLPTHSVALGQVCVSPDLAAPEAYARSLLTQDFDIESLYLDTIPETARQPVHRGRHGGCGTLGMGRFVGYFGV